MIVSTVTTSQLLSFAIAGLLPMLVALVTSRAASSAWKAWTLLALSTVNGFLTIWLDADVNHIPFDIGQALLTTGAGFCVAAISHRELLKPAGITGSTGVIARTVPRGLGARHVDSRHLRH